MWAMYRNPKDTEFGHKKGVPKQCMELPSPGYGGQSVQVLHRNMSAQVSPCRFCTEMKGAQMVKRSYELGRYGYFCLSGKVCTDNKCPNRMWRSAMENIPTIFASAGS